MQNASKIWTCGDSEQFQGIRTSIEGPTNMLVKVQKRIDTAYTDQDMPDGVFSARAKFIELYFLDQL
jgi:hypothetical protein